MKIAEGRTSSPESCLPTPAPPRDPWQIVPQVRDTLAPSFVASSSRGGFQNPAQVS